MATELQLRHDLPKLRISNVEIAVPYSNDRNSTTGQNKQSPVIENDDDGCRTPTSKESRIPEILTCPPAPRKQKRFVSCKRKLLDEFQFAEADNKEEIDAFFRSAFSKRSCRCI
ncbi:hypothetical protein L6164_007345 [Bauhinia variegata]|uniref:Uncharacterized protein n=1 Tax=Bauhinia variegata TaxID=167791 RepID=A0ACB9PCJ7_BAUVA|nr:hypothetical protein L6164_007345 [Bauhinia variegata]